MTRDERRSAALLFVDELAGGRVGPAALDAPEVRAAVRERPFPSRISRRLQRSAIAGGRLDYATHSAVPMHDARRAVLGDDAAGPPKVLLRTPGLPAVPDPFATEALAAVHAVLTAAGVPYLAGIPPRPLEDDELELLARLRHDGVAFAAHGPRLDGVRPKDLAARLRGAGEILAAAAVHPDVLEPEDDRFSTNQYPLLARSYAVVTGGPNSVELVGWHPSPLWRGDAVYLPAYPPFHGPAATSAEAVARVADAGMALWLPVVLAADEAPGAVGVLARAVSGLARDWEDFLAAVRASRAAA